MKLLMEQQADLLWIGMVLTILCLILMLFLICVKIEKIISQHVGLITFQ